MFINVVRPNVNNREAVVAHFEHCVAHTFTAEGAGEFTDEIREETQCKIDQLDLDIQTKGKERFFLLAQVEGRIIGTIAYGHADDRIRSLAKDKYEPGVEIGSMLIHPDFQGKGVGTMMISALFLAMEAKGIETFCFDSGYKAAQKTWMKKFGQPEIVAKDYWGEGYDHMVWFRKLSDMTIGFHAG